MVTKKKLIETILKEESKMLFIAEIAEILNIDASYVSKLIKQLELENKVTTNFVQEGNKRFKKVSLNTEIKQDEIDYKNYHPLIFFKMFEYFLDYAINKKSEIKNLELNDYFPALINQFSDSLELQHSIIQELPFKFMEKASIAFKKVFELGVVMNEINNSINSRSSISKIKKVLQENSELKEKVEKHEKIKLDYYNRLYS